MRVSHIDVVAPFVNQLVDSSGIFSPTLDLGICCPKGKVCCERCAFNFRFRGGAEELCLDEDTLIGCVQLGHKPVGGIARAEQDTELEEYLKACDLEIIVATRNRWNMFVYLFTTRAQGAKHFSDFIDLAKLEEEFGIRLENKTIQQHAADPAFLNERDNLVERGIVYGYPLWTSIAMQLMR